MGSTDVKFSLRFEGDLVDNLMAVKMLLPFENSDSTFTDKNIERSWFLLIFRTIKQFSFKGASKRY